MGRNCLKNRLSRQQLEERFGKWWLIKDIDALVEIRDEISTLEANTQLEKHIKNGMFFRVYAKIGELSPNHSKND